MKTDLLLYNNDWYDAGHPLKRLLWYYTSLLFFENGWFPFSTFKVFLLRVFGAKTGQRILLKPKVQIKYPWNLVLGNDIWIGEGVWIDNLAPVTIENNVCLSQSAYLLTGNHNFRSPSFDLVVKPIIIEEGGWIGAKAIVCPGIICRSHAVLSVGSIATKDLEAYSIYQGNPAVKIKERKIDSVQNK